MKKFGKFILALLSLAAIVGGAFYFVKNVLNKDSNDDFDDFDDDFDDFDMDDEEENEDVAPEKREYVSINISEVKTDSEAESKEEPNTNSEAEEK